VEICGRLGVGKCVKSKISKMSLELLYVVFYMKK
jgi:hypothetical protein